MAINFPDSPNNGDIYTVNGKKWIYGGGKWASYGLAIAPDVLKVDSVNNRVGVNNLSPSVDLDVTGDAAVSGSLTVDGDLTISGNTTTLNTTELYVEDNKVTLNSGATGSATANAGIEVERGDDPNVEILWDESVDAWKVATDFTVDAGTLHVDSTNNRVGIGTTTPTSPLHIKADSFDMLSLDRTDNANVDQQVVLAPTYSGSGNTAFAIKIGSEIMRITEEGLVGIGTTAPSAQLTVKAGSTGVNDGTVEFHKWLGSASSPTETEDWPTPVLALRSYDNFNTMNMLSFGYPQDAVYQTGGSVWSMRLAGVSGATASSSSTNLQVVGPGTLDINSPVDIAGAISTLGSAMLGVRQVLASHKTGYSLTGTAEIDTGLSVTITPKSTSSKILIFWAHGYYLSGNTRLNSRLKRGTTQLQLNYSGDQGSAGNGTANNYYLDTPNTTSAVTYKTTMQSSSTIGVYVSNSDQSSYLLVVEIL